MIKVYIASSERFAHCEWMTRFSILENTTAPVDVEIITPEGLGVPETGCTGFTNLRFAVSELCWEAGYSHAIYLDVDMMVLGDIAELWEYRNLGDWVTLVDGSDEVSIFSADCDFPPRNELHKYRKEQLRGLVPKTPRIPLEWNSEDRIVPGAKLLHFTDLNTQPWDTEHPDVPAMMTYKAYHARYRHRDRA